MDQPGLWEAERSLGTSGFLGYLTSSEAGDLTEALLTADKRRPSHSFSLEWILWDTEHSPAFQPFCQWGMSGISLSKHLFLNFCALNLFF